MTAVAIPLSQGKVALISPVDANRIGRHNLLQLHGMIQRIIAGARHE